MSTYNDILTQQLAQPAPVAPGKGMPPPTPRGDNGLMGYVEAPVAGAYGLGANIAETGQAAAKAVGLDSAAAKAAGWANYLRQAGAGFQSPDFEHNAQSHPWSPSAIGQGLLQGSPGMATVFGGAAAGTALGGPVGGLIGAGLAAFPQMVGGNVERRESQTGDLTQGQAAGALALGVPEAAIGAYPGTRAAGILAGIGKQAAAGAGEKIAAAVGAGLGQAGVGAIASAGQNLIAQQMNDRSIPFRMNEMITSALTGGAAGALVGGGLHALAKVDPNSVTSGDINKAVGQGLGLEPPPSTEGGMQGELPLEQPANPARPYRNTPQGRLDQLSTYFGGLENPDMFQQHIAGLVSAEQGQRAQDAAPRPPLGEPGPLVDTGVPQPSPDFIDLINAHAGNTPFVEGQNLAAQHVADLRTAFDMRPGEPPPAAAQEVEDTRPAFTPSDLAQQGRGESPDERQVLTPSERQDDWQAAQREKDYWAGTGHEPGPTAPPQPEPAVSLSKQDIGSRLFNAMDHTNKETQRASFLDALPDAAQVGDQPLKGAQLRAAQALDVPVDAKGKIIPETAENAVPRDVFTTKTERANWDQAQDLRPQIADAPAMTEALDKVQTTPGAPEATAILKAVEDHVATQEPAIGSSPEQRAASLAADRKAERRARDDLALRNLRNTSREERDAQIQAEIDARKLPPEPVTGPSPEAVAQVKPVDPVQASLSRLQDMTNVAKPGASPGAAILANKIWQEGLERDPTGTALWDNHLNKFNPEAQAALEAHGNVVADAQKKGLYGPRAAPTPQTQTGVDLEHIANSGTLKDQLAYLQTNGENGAIKTVTRQLAQNGVDAKVVTSDQGLPPDRGAMYDPKTNTITVRPGEATGQLVAHEAVHAGTVKALRSDSPAARDMNAAYEAVKEASPNKDAYGLQNVDEFVAESHTNPEFQDTLRSMPATDGKSASMWQQFKDIVARLVGMPTGGKRTMLDQVLETGNRLMAENRAAPEITANPLYGASDKVKQAQELQASAVPHLMGMVSSAKGALQHMLLGTDGNVDIGTVLMPRLGIESGKNFIASLKDRENITNAMDSANVKAQGGYNALNAKDKASIDKAIYLTNRGMFPDRSWNEQPVEMREAAKTSPAIKQAWVDGSRAFNDASPAGREAYALQVAGNQTQQLGNVAALVHDSVTREMGVIPGFENKPGKVFQFNEEMQSDPRKAQAALTADLNNRGKSLDALLAAGTLKPEQAKALKNARDLIDQVVSANDAVPNFHMSHGQGDYFVAGKLAADPDGRPTQAAVKGLQKILEARGFQDRHLDVLNDNPAVFARVENAGIAKKLRAAFQEAAAAGHLDAEHGIKSGLAEEGGLEGLMPKQMKDYLRSVEADRPNTEGLDEAGKKAVNAAWDQHVKETRRGLMDLLPSSSATKLLAKKENVQLQTKDIGAAFQYRAAAGSRRFGNLSTSSDYSAAISAMRDELNAVKSNPDIPIEKQELAQKALQQLLVNQVDRPTSPPAAFVGALKGLSYRMELASPAYMALLHSQVYTLVLPRLGSVVGYVKGAKYLAQSAPDMFRVLRGMMLDEHWTSGGVREENMIKAGLSSDRAKLAAEADNRGLWSGSSFTKQMAPNEEGSGVLAKVANMSSAFILYCEMHPRILATLGAERAWKEMPAEQQGQFKGDKWNFIEQMVNKSSLDFSASNNARIQSRAGPLGETAPLFTQFTKFRSMLTAQLYRDFEDGFVRKDATPEERQQARSFLLGHLAATTMLAGSLGMPMVGVLASVADKLADWATGDPTHDFIASYRGWLTHMYGPTAGEAIARGLPRLASFDFSKAGEASLVPWVSDALMIGTEKRKLEDAERDWLKKVAGPAIGLPVDWALGARDILNGDYLRGMQKMVPEGLHGGVEAAEAMKYGFRDKTGMMERIGGHQLTPTAQDIAMLALGITPAKNAEYDEQQRVAFGLSTRRQIESQNITQHLLQAYQRGDQADLAYWENQAGPVWMAQHPGTMPPIAHFGEALNARYRQQAYGLPQGINVRDIRAKGMINFANPH